MAWLGHIQKRAIQLTTDLPHEPHPFADYFPITARPSVLFVTYRTSTDPDVVSDLSTDWFAAVPESLFTTDWHIPLIRHSEVLVELLGVLVQT